MKIRSLAPPEPLNEGHVKGCVLRYGATGGVNACSCKKLRRDAQYHATEKQNPKLIQAQKDGKIPMEYLVYSVLADDARCHQGGGDKYGVRNWREDRILASTYEGAMLRHFIAWASGEDKDLDSGLSHLTHLRACCAVVLDAEVHGTLIDDRDRVESKDKTEGEQNVNQSNV